MAELFTAFGTLITGLALLVNAVVNAGRLRNLKSQVSSVHEEVKTANGITLAALADNAEGRRINADIPHDERTTAEQRYVDRVKEGED